MNSSPLSRHVIEVRCDADGAEVSGSPAVIEAADAFDADLQQTVANAVAAVAADADRDRVLSFILQQADRLRQQRADAEAQRVGRLAHKPGRGKLPFLFLRADGHAASQNSRRGKSRHTDPNRLDHRPSLPDEGLSPPARPPVNRVRLSQWGGMSDVCAATSGSFDWVQPPPSATRRSTASVWICPWVCSRASSTASSWVSAVTTAVKAWVPA